MAWELRQITAENLKTDTVVQSNGAAFAKLKDGRLATTSDYETWHISAWPSEFDVYRVVYWTGTQWLVVDLANRILRSLDGVVGALWSISYPTNLPSSVSSLRIVSNGRIIVGSALNKSLWISDDAGDTWTQTGQLFGSGNGTYDIRWYQSQSLITACCASSQFAFSLDNGSTWTKKTPASLKSVLRALHTGAQFVFNLSGGHHLSYSYDGGLISYSAYNDLNGFYTRSQDVLGATLYDVTSPDGYLLVRSHTGAIDTNTVLSPFDMTGLPTGQVVGTSLVEARPDRLILLLRRSGYTYSQFYVYPLTPPVEYASLDWPVEVTQPQYAALLWPVDVAAGPVQSAALPWPIKVGAAQSAALPWPVAVLPDSVVGGLDGAGAWAAAPDGRWAPVVHLSGADISARLTGPVIVRHAANAAATAEFSFLPSAPLQPMALIGQPVVIAFAQFGGINAQRMFAGVVDVPEVDVQTGQITVTCTDAAREAWNSTPRETIAAMVGGRWHAAVSRDPESNFDYLEERLESVGKSWARDAYGGLQILPWADASKAYTVRDADVLDGSLAVSMPSRDQLLTRINVRMQYRYPVLKARYARCNYAQSLWFFLPSQTATSSYPGAIWMTTAMVKGATEVPGWVRRSLEIEHPPARSWRIGSSLNSGYYTIPPSVAGDLVLSFAASYATRWRQTVTEDYTIEVVCPQLEQMVGQPVSEEIGASLESELDQPGWESDDTMGPLGIVGGAFPLLGDQTQSWAAPGASTDDRDEAIRTLLDRAWVRLWAASRSGRVSFALPCRPDIWLDAYVQVESGAVRAAGKAVEIEHTLDVLSGSAVSELTLAVGLPGATPAAQPDWALPPAPPPDYTAPLSAYSFKCGTFLGGQAGAPPYDPETMVGFSTNVQGAEDPALEYYPHQLSIKAPDIAAEERDPQTRPATARIDVSVPTDLLEII